MPRVRSDPPAGARTVRAGSEERQGGAGVRASGEEDPRRRFRILSRLLPFRARGDRTGEALIALIDALTTNHHQLFFGRQSHFDFLRNGGSAGVRGGRESIDIWCAACSTGEEPYSVAFTLLDARERDLPGSTGPASFRILATDISTRALDAARAAVYPAERFDEVCRTAWLRKYLLRGRAANGRATIALSRSCAKLVEFQRLNLIEPISHGRSFHRDLLPERDDLFRQADAGGSGEQTCGLAGTGRVISSWGMRRA